jgi:hypothetical protein
MLADWIQFPENKSDTISLPFYKTSINSKRLNGAKRRVAECVGRKRGDERNGKAKLRERHGNICLGAAECRLEHR